VTPFWHHLPERGVPDVTLDVPYSETGRSPPGAVEVIGWGMHEGVWRTSRPAGLLEDLNKRHGHAAQEREGPGERTDEFIAGELPDVIGDVGRRTAIIEDLACRYPWRLLLAVYSETHRAGHWYWSERGTGVPQGGVRKVLKALDDQLPRLRGLLRPQDQMVVFAVHGMEATHDVDRLGVAAVEYMTGDHSRRLLPRDPVLAVRNLMPVSIARTIARRLPQGLYNWTYYRLQNSRGVRPGAPWVIRPLDHVVFAYLRDRSLSPEARRAAIDALEKDFFSIRTPEGEPVVDKVFRAADELDGARARLLPDLIIRATQRAIGANLVLPDGTVHKVPRNASRDGEHHPEGFYIQVGPGIPAGSNGPEFRGQDLAPYLLAPAGIRL
jgi:hypothetical protein